MPPVFYSLVCKLYFLAEKMIIGLFLFLGHDESSKMILIRELISLGGKWCKFSGLPRVCSMLELD